MNTEIAYLYKTVYFVCKIERERNSTADCINDLCVSIYTILTYAYIMYDYVRNLTSCLLLYVISGLPDCLLYIPYEPLIAKKGVEEGTSSNS